ncbi:Chromosomal replication initiator, DnaA C-terminal [uncultured Caudovirales phage]|uniref:Chromosomal replication initiator, DnaA C-terminal n=1 Tax=uncultured Caudovirales phage TaxID=2100421 RepID=A0A6J7XCQ8_9CAUD|nr:Chromosomal replication initiator, DnaA C-terminal [uncultured Caudovirales phage]
MMTTPVTMASIVADVAAAHRLPVADLMGRSTLKWVVVARHEAMWRIRQVMWADGVTPRYSLPQIGRYFSRHHTTVIHACKQHPKRHIHAF